MKMEQTQCSETSAIKHHTQENNPKGYTRHTEHGESLKSRTLKMLHEIKLVSNDDTLMSVQLTTNAIRLTAPIM
jgi:hypothetical protein